MKKLAAITVAALFALALAGCGSQAASNSPASSATSSESASAEAPSASAVSQTVTTANWTDVKTADEAAKGAGFNKFGVMNKITIDGQEYANPKFAYADGVAQATYEPAAIALIVRKADGKHTATLTDRDKAEFANTWSKSYEGLDVTCYGAAKGAATVFTWADGTKEYGVTYQGLGGEEVTLDSDEVSAIVKAIKEADGTAKTEASKQESDENAKQDADEDAGEVAVPNVIGMTAADAAAALSNAGLSADGDSVGTVIDQTPAAGAMIDPGDTVSFKTDADDDDNAGEVVVPNVIGMEAGSAAATIEGAGLSADGNPAGTVVDQTPAAGAMVDPGDTVSFKTDAAE